MLLTSSLWHGREPSGSSGCGLLHRPKSARSARRITGLLGCGRVTQNRRGRCRRQFGIVVTKFVKCAVQASNTTASAPRRRMCWPQARDPKREPGFPGHPTRGSAARRHQATLDGIGQADRRAAAANLGPVR